MKKLFILLVISGVALTYASSQESTFFKDSKVVNLGIGFGTYGYFGTYYSVNVPPISASFEMGIADNVLEKGVIGIGGYLGFSSYSWEYSNWGYNYTNIILGGRGIFHYPLVDKLDTYTGLLMGFRVVSKSEYGTPIPGYDYSVNRSRPIAAWFVGARYYLSDNFAVMAEIGYGISYLNLGVSLKL